LPGALAALLDLPQLTFARAIDVEGTTVTVQRATETGYQVIQASLPAFITVTASVGEPRYSSFKGMMAAKRKPSEVRDVAALGLDPAAVGQLGAQERVLEVRQIQAKKQGHIVMDDRAGSSVEEILAFLRSIQVL